ncbi:MAG: hypothetical protein PHY56_00280 [Candidatus Omnitrophica bacterium]|nr:hypothetical protein [Candidatus Omnitrophota bacterium]
MNKKLCKHCGCEIEQGIEIYYNHCRMIAVEEYNKKIYTDKRLQMRDILSDKRFSYNFITHVGRF